MVAGFARHKGQVLITVDAIGGYRGNDGRTGDFLPIEVAEAASYA